MNTPAEIAAAFKGSRDQFGALFDDISSANDGKKFKFVAVNVHDKISAFIKALKYAKTEGWLARFTKKAIASKLITSNLLKTDGVVAALPRRHRNVP